MPESNGTEFESTVTRGETVPGTTAGSFAPAERQEQAVGLDGDDSLPWGGWPNKATGQVYVELLREYVENLFPQDIADDWDPEDPDWELITRDLAYRLEARVHEALTNMVAYSGSETDIMEDFARAFADEADYGEIARRTVVEWHNLAEDEVAELARDRALDLLDYDEDAPSSGRG